MCKAWLLILLLAWGSLPALAQEDATEAPPPSKEAGVRILFLPPPLPGTLSLGVYTKGGKLVRTLRREAKADRDFTMGLNGLILQWDGLDAAGKAAPAGTYQVRGFGVKGVAVEGEAFLGNDWVVDEQSPRVVSIQNLALERGGTALVVEATVQGGGQVELRCLPGGEVTVATEKLERAELSAGGTLPTEVKPLARCAGREGSTWTIEKTEDGVAVTQYSPSGELLRALSIGADEPVPEAIVAAPDAETIYLLERNATETRLRGLALAGAAEGESVWKTVLQKRLVRCETPEVALPALGRTLPAGPYPTKLLPNPLFKNALGQTSLQVQVEPKGSTLCTADGLPLYRVTDTPNLKWAVLLRGDKSQPATLLQSDGTVVESYRLRGLTQMMAFDAGEYEVKR